ncbi:DNA ligase 4 [Nymphon striatum]|nr:DNA ligase 4 [Nymphon striatum]
MYPACTNIWVRDLGNYRYPVEKIGECTTQYGKKDPRNLKKMAKTVASNVPFSDLCRVCEKICNKQGKEKKIKSLKLFIDTWRNFHDKLHNDNINIFTLARLYIEILVLNKNGEDAQSLLNFRTQQAKANAGDFASVAFSVLKNRCPDSGKLTIEDVNNHLNDIAQNSAAKNKDQMKHGLMKLLQSTSAIEQKWLIRMILKDMRLGISEQSILNAFHVDAKDLYDVSNSLSKVCLTLKDPKVRLHEIEISIFNPFRPMLGERAVPEKVMKLMNDEPFYIETKFDGERVQIHKQKNEYKFFSRNGNDYSHVFGSSSSRGTLAQYIHPQFEKEVTSFIIDGEMMGYNKDSKTIGSKGQNFDVKCLKDGDDYQPMFVAFDILLYNSKVLSNLSLRERSTYLKKLFKTLEGRLQLSEQTIGNSRKDVISALNSAIDNREEGIVVKNPLSLYKPNTRKGGWLKIKPEYVDSIIDQLDLIIVGGYFGEGRRSGMISHFLLAVAVPNHGVCKVGTGYSFQELHDLCSKLNDHWKVYDKKSPPSNILLQSGHKEKPDLYIEPSKSFIVQVKAAEIIKSDRFMTGCTLRFPRVEIVRYDKPWYDCMTLTELMDLYQQASGKLATRHMTNEAGSEDELSPKKKRLKVQVQQPISIAPHFRAADLSSVKQETKLFAAWEFCVINDSKSNTKQQLEKMIAVNGGKIVQNPGSTTSMVISSKFDLRTRNLIKCEMYDIVKSDWLQKCLTEFELIPFKNKIFDHVHMLSSAANFCPGPPIVYFLSKEPRHICIITEWPSSLQTNLRVISSSIVATTTCQSPNMPPDQGDIIMR